MEFMEFDCMCKYSIMSKLWEKEIEKKTDFCTSSKIIASSVSKAIWNDTAEWFELKEVKMQEVLR